VTITSVVDVSISVDILVIVAVVIDGVAVTTNVLITEVALTVLVTFKNVVPGSELEVFVAKKELEVLLAIGVLVTFAIEVTGRFCIPKPPGEVEEELEEVLEAMSGVLLAEGVSAALLVDDEGIHQLLDELEELAMAALEVDIRMDEGVHHSVVELLLGITAGVGATVFDSEEGVHQTIELDDGELDGELDGVHQTSELEELAIEIAEGDTEGEDALAGAEPPLSKPLLIS
jgi:hypothetical protein